MQLAHKIDADSEQGEGDEELEAHSQPLPKGWEVEQAFSRSSATGGDTTGEQWQPEHNECRQPHIELPLREYLYIIIGGEQRLCQFHHCPHTNHGEDGHEERLGIELAKDIPARGAEEAAHVQLMTAVGAHHGKEVHEVEQAHTEQQRSHEEQHPQVGS